MRVFFWGNGGRHSDSRQTLLQRHPSLGLLGMLVLATGFLTWREVTQDIDLLHLQNEKALVAIRGVLEQLLAWQRAEVLAAGPTLQLQLVNSGALSPERSLDRPELEAIFTDFLGDNPNISQIRWLDPAGMERARVNQTRSANGERDITSAAVLQDKSDRDYFLHGIDLASGDAYISRLDLNREFGKIVRPPEPTLRVALPTSAGLNQRSGVLVLNFTVEPLLEAISFRAQSMSASVDLLDGVTGKVYSSMSNPDLAWAHELKDPPVYYRDIYPGRFQRIREFLSGNPTSGNAGDDLIVSAAPRMQVTDGTLVAYIFMPPEIITAERRAILAKSLGAAGTAWLIGGLLLIRLFNMETRNMRTLREVQALSSAKSQFLANMSHEIRTPIAGMVGMLDLLAEDIREPAQKERLDFIRQCTRTLRRVIDDILDISKLQGGRVMLESKSFHPARTVERTVTLYAVDSRLKSVGLKAMVPEELAGITVEGDEHRLSQVLNNLVSNAVKFTEHGEVVAGMQELMRSGMDVTLRFSVRDTGIGMASDVLEVLGQPFVQADVSTTRVFGGTGLGLSICKSLLALMGSELRIDSEPGQGSTFSFDLTLSLAGSETTERDGLPVDNPPGGLPVTSTPAETNDGDGAATREGLMQRLARAIEERGSPRVLVAEDSFAMQVLIGEIFKSFSIPVEFADNGKLALERLDEQPFDLVFMDLQMPEMGGIEAIGYLRQKWTSAQLPVIVLSAVTEVEEIANAIAAGGDKCLSKPIDIEQLLTTLLDYWHPKAA